MSVLACDRNGCENIMCDRYSTKYGYICWECYKEIVNSNFHPKEFMHSLKHDEDELPLFDYDKIFPFIRSEND